MEQPSVSPEAGLDKVKEITDQIREILTVERVSPDDGDRISALMDQGAEAVSAISDPAEMEEAQKLLSDAAVAVQEKLGQ